MVELNHSCASRAELAWELGGRRLNLGARTWVMAVVNLTADSFYAASRSAGPSAAVARAAEAVTAGADLIDLGAESTRPGSAPTAERDEQSRLLPALEAVRRAFPDLLISVDTRHAATAAAALDAGADIINDVTGAEQGGMARLLAERGCGAILMHRRGEFAAMQRLAPLADPAATVMEGLERILRQAQQAGLRSEQIVLDPGFGFGKNLEQNFPLLAHIGDFTRLGRPILVGMSRKSFIGHALGGAGEVPAEARLIGSVAAATAAVLGGAHIVRTHDVAETLEAVKIADAVLAAQAGLTKRGAPGAE